MDPAAAGRIDEEPRVFLERHGVIRHVFGWPEQDSGNVSFDVATPAGRYLVKTAGDPADELCPLDHPARVALLRNGAVLRHAVDHPLLPVLHGVVEGPTGPLLFWERVPGERLDTRAPAQADPGSVHAWLAARPAVAARLLADLLELHVEIVAAGWIAGDLYDGCLLFDRATERLSVIDLDCYHRGPTTNTMGRMFGSSRWMAPEEFARGAAIDERTTVYTLGRAIAWILGDGTDDRSAFRGGNRQWETVRRATAAEPAARIQTVATLAAAFAEDPA